MATSNTGFLSTSELDFSAIKANLITYLKNQSQFTDYNFDATNLNVLLDILSYNTYLQGFYLNMVGSEMFLDTAQLKESAVSHSKELNYLPQSRTSAVAYVGINIDTGINKPSYILIPKGYRFNTTMDNVPLVFTVPTDLYVRPVNGVYSVANTAIYEGNIVTEYFNVAANNSYVLQSENIDTSSITVSVFESNTSTTSYNYTRADSLFNLTPYSNVYFIQGYSQNEYQLSFGNDITGRSLPVGSKIKVDYRDTLGELGNGAFNFKKSAPVDGYNTISVTTNFAAAEGSERETIDSIKFNAPRYFPVQERAVTAEDYIALTRRQFPQIQSVVAIGGENLSPPQYGKVAISLKPYGSVGLVSDSLKANIINYLKLKNLTTEPIIIEPEFFYIFVTSNVNYNSSVTSLSSNQIVSLVQNAIFNYGTTNLTDFGSNVRYSKLVQTIDAVDISVVSNDTSLKIIKRWTPKLGVSSSASFSFENELFHEQSLYALPQGHEQPIQTDSFTYTHTDGNDYSSYIADDGLGHLYVYTLLNINGVATRTVLNYDAGSVDYYTGNIIIKANIKSYIGNYINIYGLPKNKDILAQKNKFLIIDGADVVVNLTDIATT
jgi:hypothetical protein